MEHAASCSNIFSTIKKKCDDSKLIFRCGRSVYALRFLEAKAVSSHPGYRPDFRFYCFTKTVSGAYLTKQKKCPVNCFKTTLKMDVNRVSFYYFMGVLGLAALAGLAALVMNAF
ncbi:MAG: hypothetical protein D6714_06150 [Bacteroidetes bacterium]|nr:MAG: hypothetical protein D6714_06150 [Bacteroidota bacterium]